jgi:hypothetical protein
LALGRILPNFATDVRPKIAGRELVSKPAADVAIPGN